jgi:hypothetical protein
MIMKLGAGGKRESAWSLGNFRRPTCMFAIEAAHTGAPRFLAENILSLDLEMPIRTTCGLGDPQAQVAATLMPLQMQNNLG